MMNHPVRCTLMSPSLEFQNQTVLTQTGNYLMVKGLRYMEELQSVVQEAQT